MRTYRAESGRLWKAYESHSEGHIVITRMDPGSSSINLKIEPDEAAALCQMLQPVVEKAAKRGK